MVGHSHLADGSERIDVGAATFRSSSDAGSQHHQRFEGKQPINEDDVLEVCSILRDALRDQGDQWGPFELQEQDVTDVDAVAVDDAGRTLAVQVVRAEQAAWGLLAKTGLVDRQVDAARLAAAVVGAVDRKAKKYPVSQRRGLVLALDSIRAPGHVQRVVVDQIRAEHVDKIADAGFAAVWLVGPTVPLTYQLA